MEIVIDVHFHMLSLGELLLLYVSVRCCVITVLPSSVPKQPDLCYVVLSLSFQDSEIEHKVSPEKLVFPSMFFAVT